MELFIFVSLMISSDFIHMVSSTGAMYDPVARSLMWKYQFPVERNYDYMMQNCGGVLQEEFGPKQCGICGDPPNGPKEHEAGGKYGSRMISRYYPKGTKEIVVKIELITFPEEDKEGFFEFRICAANDTTVTQKCLDDTQLPIKEGYMAGTPLRFCPGKAGDFHLTVALPPDLVCDRCVLQWRYRSGANWGTDPASGKEVRGKGPQEEFYNCADVRIGGPIPESLMSNLYFAPPDPLIYTKTKTKIDPTTIERPTRRRKTLAKENHPFCPPVPEGIVGTCVEECTSDVNCTNGRVCCPNGCGHICQTKYMLGQSSFVQTEATAIPGQIPGNVRDTIHQHLDLGFGGPVVVGGKGTHAKTNASMTSNVLDAGLGASGSAAAHMKGAGTTSGMAMEHSVHGAAASGHSQHATHGAMQGDRISTGAHDQASTGGGGLTAEQALQAIEEQLRLRIRTTGETAQSSQLGLSPVPGGTVVNGSSSLADTTVQQGDFNLDKIATPGAGVQDIVGMLAVDSGHMNTGVSSGLDTHTGAVSRKDSASLEHGHTGGITVDRMGTSSSNVLHGHDMHVSHAPSSTLHPQSEMAKEVAAARARLTHKGTETHIEPGVSIKSLPPEMISTSQNLKTDTLSGGMGDQMIQSGKDVVMVEHGIHSIGSTLPSSSQSQSAASVIETSAESMLPIETTKGASPDVISVDMQKIKHADMSNIFAKLNMIADKGQAQEHVATVEAGSLSVGQETGSESNLQDVMGSSPAIQGKTVQVQRGITNQSTEQYPLEPIAHNMADLHGDILSQVNAVDIALQRDAATNQITDKIDKKGGIFTGKVIQAQDVVQESAAERGLSRAAKMGTMKKDSLNDINLLSSETRHDNAMPTRSKPHQAAFNVDTVMPKATGVENTLASLSSGVGSNEKSIIDKGHTKPKSETLNDVIKQSTGETANVPNSGPLPSIEGLKEIQHHKNEAQAEKTIQQVTTKNTTLPDGSSVIETKTKTVELKVKETTKVTSGKADGTKDTIVGEKAIKSKPNSMTSALLQDKHISGAKPQTNIGNVQPDLQLTGDKLSQTETRYQPDIPTFAEGAMYQPDIAPSGFEMVLENALQGMSQEAKMAKPKNVVSDAKDQSLSMDILGDAGLADIKPDMLSAGGGNLIGSSPDVNMLGEGLSKIAKMTHDTGPKEHSVKSKKGNTDINITSKKAKVNIKKDNTKRVVSEFDVSKNKQQKIKPEVALIIMGADKQGPEITLESLAQKIDQINQLDTSLSRKELAPPEPPKPVKSVPNRSATVESKPGLERQTQPIPASTQRKGNIIEESPLATDALSLPPGLPDQIDFRDVLPVTDTRTGRRSSSANRESVFETSSIGRENLIDRHRDSRRPPPLMNSRGMTSEVPRTERRSMTRSMRSDRPGSSTDRRRGVSFAAGERRMSGSRDGNIRSRSMIRTESRMPPFSSGLTEGLRTGPDSGVLTPELRAEFERRRRGRDFTAVGRRVAGDEHRSFTFRGGRGMGTGPEPLSLRDTRFYRGTESIPRGGPALSDPRRRSHFSSGRRLEYETFRDGSRMPVSADSIARSMSDRRYFARRMRGGTFRDGSAFPVRGGSTTRIGDRFVSRRMGDGIFRDGPVLSLSREARPRSRGDGFFMRRSGDLTRRPTRGPRRGFVMYEPSFEGGRFMSDPRSFATMRPGVPMHSLEASRGSRLHLRREIPSRIDRTAATREVVSPSVGRQGMAGSGLVSGTAVERVERRGIGRTGERGAGSGTDSMRAAGTGTGRSSIRTEVRETRRGITGGDTASSSSGRGDVSDSSFSRNTEFVPLSSVPSGESFRAPLADTIRADSSGADRSSGHSPRGSSAGSRRDTTGGSTRVSSSGSMRAPAGDSRSMSSRESVRARSAGIPSSGDIFTFAGRYPMPGRRFPLPPSVYPGMPGMPGPGPGPDLRMLRGPMYPGFGSPGFMPPYSPFTPFGPML